MKKNIFLFTPDSNLSADINCLLTFTRKPLPLNEFFKKIPDDILNEKLDELEFQFENNDNEHAEHFFVKFKTKNKIELTNKDLSSFGLTITDKNQLFFPLLVAKKETPECSLKNQLTTLIKAADNINKKLILDTSLDCIKGKTLKLLENKNKQTEITIFFEFLKKILEQKNNYSTKSILKYTNDKFISWFTSENGTFILGPTACFSKKYNEIDNLIDKLSPFIDLSSLRNQLTTVNIECLQKLLNINPIEEEILKKIKAIEIIQNFQCQAKSLIKEFQENNLLSLEQLNFFHKILNAIAKLMPCFIVPKKTRVGFFQQYTPQKEILLKIEKNIQPFLLNH